MHGFSRKVPFNAVSSLIARLQECTRDCDLDGSTPRRLTAASAAAAPDGKCRRAARRGRLRCGCT
eukprot:2476029-Pleurochrysis_carterae.AAC.1